MAWPTRRAPLPRWQRAWHREAPTSRARTRWESVGVGSWREKGGCKPCGPGPAPAPAAGRAACQQQQCMQQGACSRAALCQLRPCARITRASCGAAPPRRPAASLLHPCTSPLALPPCHPATLPHRLTWAPRSCACWLPCCSCAAPPPRPRPCTTQPPGPCCASMGRCLGACTCLRALMTGSSCWRRWRAARARAGMQARCWWANHGHAACPTAQPGARTLCVGCMGMRRGVLAATCAHARTHTHTGGHAAHVLATLNALRGPWALLYWHPATATLWFGRDVLGGWARACWAYTWCKGAWGVAGAGAAAWGPGACCAAG